MLQEIPMKTILFFLTVLILNCRSAESRADFYNSNSEAEKHKPAKVLETLKLKSSDSVADIGSGGGYYVLRFAETAKTVYAVDVDAELLSVIKKRAEAAGRKNVVTVNAMEKNSGLPDASVDLIFSRDSFHHLPDQVEYFSGLKKAMKPSGRVAIIDYKKNAGLYLRFFNHYTEPEEILSKMEKAGFVLQEKFDFIEDQSFFIFVPASVIKK